jgi:hypothetical protein
VQWRAKIIEPVCILLDAHLLYLSLDVLHPALALLATPLLHSPPYANRAKTDSGGSVVSSQIPVWCDKGASITVSATFGYSECRRRPRTPPSSGDAVLWPSR